MIVGVLEENSHILTTCGKLINLLEISVSLGRLIYFGIITGVENEAAIIAAALSVSQSPFRNIKSTSKYRHPDHTNSLIKTYFDGNRNLDSGFYSDHLLLFNLFVKYHNTQVPYRGKEVVKLLFERYVLDSKTIEAFYRLGKQIIENIEYAKNRLRSQNIDANLLPLIRNINIQEIGPRDQRIIILRSILTWACDGNIIRTLKQNSVNNNNVLIRDHPQLLEDKINELFPGLYQEYSIVSRFALEIDWGGEITDSHEKTLYHTFLTSNSNINLETTKIIFIWKHLTYGNINEQKLIIISNNEELLKKFEDSFRTAGFDDQFESRNAADELTFITISSSLRLHEFVTTIRDDFPNLLEIFIIDKTKWNLRVTNFNNHDSVLNTITTFGIYHDFRNISLVSHNLNGYLRRQSEEANNLNGYINFKFKTSIEREGSKISDISLGRKLNNAYCLCRFKR